MILKPIKWMLTLVCLAMFCFSGYGQGNPPEDIAKASVRSAPLFEQPSWWSFQYFLMIFGGLILVILFATFWILMLRRKMQEQIALAQQSETQFRSLIEQTLVGIYIIQDNRFVYVNPRMAHIFGYTEAEMLNNCSLENVILEADRAMVQERLRERFENQTASAHYTFRGVRKDGAVIYAEVLGNRSEYKGRPAVVGTLMDITERKKASAELEQASSFLASLLENSPDCIYFKDLESRFIRYSKAFVEFLNLSNSQELEGKTDFDLFTEEHARPAYEDEQRIIRTGEPITSKLEKETRTDGRITWALTTKLPWRDKNGNIIGTFGISKNITDIKETENKLAHERQLFRELLNNLPDAIYFKDIESHFVRISASKVERARYFLLNRYHAAHPEAQDAELPDYLTSNEKCHDYLLGKTDFDIFPEDRAASAYKDEQQIIRTGLPLIGKLEKTTQHDGAYIWYLTTKMPWRDESGNIVGTFGVSRDITDIKDAEAQLETAHQRLIETSRLAGMAEVASDVLHNVGNVLNSVNVSCSLTIDRVKTSKVGSLTKISALLNENQGRLGDFFSNDPRAQQIPAYMSALAEHFTHEQGLLLQELEQLIKHIDHIKQIVAMQQSYAKVAGVVETINPSQLVEDALHINAAALTRHDVHLQREFQETPLIMTEKHKVLQILVNLIRNAKYALDEVRHSNKLMTIRICKDGNEHIKIQVVDNGIGIPPENLTRIFGHGFTTRANGHGFGLHSSALSIKELGGSLHAHSDGTGKGATFTILLPQQPPAKEIS